MKRNISLLSPELVEKLKQLEKQKPEYKTYEVMSDIASMTKKLIEGIDKQSSLTKSLDESIKEYSKSVSDKLEQLNRKESPDYTGPLVKKIEELTKQLGEKEFSPEIKVQAPEVKVPNVVVPTPIANVDVKAPKIDFSKLETLISKDIPKAFKQAVESIPQPPEPVDRWDEVLEWLQSIDTASRARPQAPNVLKVVNPDGTNVASEISLAVRIDDTTTANTTYIGKAPIGSATSSAVWQISKLDTSSGLIKTWADGSSSFTQIWDDRATITYQ